ncbi:tail fiber assembly protein [Pseudomonas bijieensis]|uniref:tail fiber assembly protein n=1 Tax=Pseudomonas bijieensis TaxID=2681983 RepID=UPI001E2B638F|nr:tail fiber assembly protein [Pseudomonas bijieensis]MCD9116270.1 tail fiber assembly protein [Pseudomonas bijieensis]
MFASKTTRGFYDAAIHVSMPDDVVEVSTEKHAELLAAQSEGKVIAWDDDGFPVLIDPPLPTFAQLVQQERVWRDGELLATDHMVTRHRDELEEGTVTTLTTDQYGALQTYRRALRNWPEAGEFPLIDHRPPAPDWLATKLQ